MFKMSRKTEMLHKQVKNNELRKSLDTASMRKASTMKNSVAKNLRRSAPSSLALEKISPDPGFADIEAEYIRNLQQQIYFLELEAAYLREQNKKSSEIRPKMSAETDRLVKKVKQMQSHLEDANSELKRREASFSVIENEKLKLMEKLRQDQADRQSEKGAYTDEIIELKKDKVLLERDVSRRDDTITELRSDVEKHLVAIKTADMTIANLKSQLEQRIEEHKMTQILLEERRADLLTSQTQLKAVENSYYNSTVQVDVTVADDLREEMRSLRQKIKETEFNLDQERHLKIKVSGNQDSLMAENSSLHQKLSELQSQIAREAKMRDINSERHTKSMNEFITLQDKCKQLSFDVSYKDESLKKERELNQQLMDQVSQLGNHDVKLNTSRSRVTELESLYETMKLENDQLTKDKLILVDHIADIQSKLSSRDEDILSLRHDLASAQRQIDTVEGLNDQELIVQNEKWQEFSRLAESMQQLSATMLSRKSLKTE